MHEFAIAENITQIVKDSLQGNESLRVCSVSLQIGRLSGIEIDALQFALGITFKGTPAESADIRFTITEGRGKCEDCEKECCIEDLFSPCPHCNSFRITITSGQEMRITSIEVETLTT